MPQGRALRINRFTVMAMLQAARARHLGLSEESAYSWGLNRAIWYAAAKRGFSGGGGGGAGPGGGEAKAKPGNVFYLGQDFAYRDPNSSKVVFILGGKTQTRKEFREKIASRFGGVRNFRKAWAEATNIVSGANEDFLKSGEMFYSQVYKPRRDDLVKKWTAEFAPSREAADATGKR
ncbi:MAG TPA: hypothetical protein VEY12_13145 [Thermoplasmata archaeon]|nr:hypothetical protein [Thermoplasmata archaeon]